MSAWRRPLAGQAYLYDRSYSVSVCRVSSLRTSGGSYSLSDEVNAELHRPLIGASQVCRPCRAVARRRTNIEFAAARDAAQHVRGARRAEIEFVDVLCVDVLSMVLRTSVMASRPPLLMVLGTFATPRRPPPPVPSGSTGLGAPAMTSRPLLLPSRSTEVCT